ncbi:DUF2066 domain-containing protein [Colwelliaceae bacterium 6471]
MKLNPRHSMIRYWFVLISLFTFSFAQAIEVEDLYLAKVPVQSQASNLRANAIKQALAAVFLKVGGKQSAIEQPIFKQAIRNYNKYLSQYRYEKQQDNMFLVAMFNEDKVNALFVEANTAIWGRLRPQILLWGVEENKLSRSLLGELSGSELPIIVNRFSRERGLPIIMPLMDIEDSNNIQVADIWGRFENPILQASSRYNAEAVIILRISNSSLVPQKEDESNCQPLCKTIVSDYVLDWSLISDNQGVGRQQFGQRYQGRDKDSLVVDALNDITELIYQGYALSTVTSNEFVIDVANINSIETFMKVYSFIEELSAVKALSLVAVNENNYRFNIHLLGSKSALLSSLKLNNLLTQYIDPLAPPDIDDVPVFYWKNQ